MSKLSMAKQRVLNIFEGRTDAWTFHEFERELEASMGSRYGNYQTAKMTISEAHKERAWPKTVKRYVLSNYAAFKNSSLPEICDELLTNMSDEEKRSYGLST